MKFLNTLILLLAMSAGMLWADADSVSRSRAGYPLVVPQVQKLMPSSGSFSLPGKLTLSCPETFAFSMFADIYEQTVMDGMVEQVTDDALCRFELADDGVPNSLEGYTLDIAESSIVVRARDVHGLYYGMQTLGWMLRNRANTTELPCCSVTDWPDLNMRGLYLQLHRVKPQEIDRICHVIDTLGALKYNTLLVGFSSNFPFEDYPFALRKEHLSRTDIEKLLAAAKRNHIEIIPALQLISHAAWLCDHPDWKKFFAYEVKNPHTAVYCLSKPEVQSIVEKVVREICDLVKPRYFHIGLDEIYECGFPECSKCKNADQEKLILEHLRPIRNFFTDQGITPIIYQDQFFGFGELSGKKHDTIANLPEQLGGNLAVMSWEYGSNPDDTLATAIRQRGFDDLWYMSFAINIKNCENLPRLAARVGATGNILAYWSMVPMTLTGHDDRRSVFYASTIAQANYSWNATDAEFSRIPIDSAMILRELLDGRPEWIFRGKATPLPLEMVFNQTLNDERMFPQFDHDTLEQIRTIVASDSAKFELKTLDHSPLAVVLSGCQEDGLPTAPVAIPVHNKATGASFLMTAAAFNNIGMVDDGTWFPIGALDIVYEDGQQITIPLELRRNINDWNAYIGGNACRAVVRGSDRNQALFNLNAIDWRNPRPNMEIKEFRLSSKGDTWFSPILLACSLSDAEHAPFMDEMNSLPPRKQMPAPEFITAVDFKNGIPEGSRCRGDGVPEMCHQVIHDEKHGDVLEVQIAKASVFSRALADLTIQLPREFGSVVFDLQVSDWRQIYRPDVFVMNREASQVLGAQGFISEIDNRWHTICIPRSRILPKEGGGIDPRTAEVIRVGFFLQQVSQPLTIRLGKIDFCDQVLPCRINCTVPVQ